MSRSERLHSVRLVMGRGTGAGAETVIVLLAATAETWGRLKPIRGDTAHLQHGI